ncbi:MAG: hypothetical protein C0402_05255 [Thermodesulfovibrio sp.]|nr:hypothetical protein [Thermodesulfovibrio sp.]
MNPDESIWTPIRNVLQDASVEAFMYMGSVTHVGGASVFLYKHFGCRRYLNIDAEGKFYRYNPSKPTPDQSYFQISLEDALKPFVEDGWPLLLRMSPEMPSAVSSQG